MEEGGTFLEDFLLSLELLPNDFRRDFELMKDLDRECIEQSKEIARLEEAVLVDASYLKQQQQKGTEIEQQINTRIAETMQELHSLRSRAKQKLAQKTSIANSMSEKIEKFSRKLDSDLAFFETELKGCGEFETRKGAEPGSEVAFKIRDKSSGGENMILGKVICYHGDKGQYDILDVDDSQKYLLPESEVIVLDLVDNQRKLCKGETVFALYEDTTSFYMATVTQAPRRSLLGGEPCVVVQFVGDEDLTGSIPPKTVSLKYVLRPPGEE